uniref:Mutant acetylcholine receptor monepantel-1 n=1 Tax=Haemonchus contortus TaxID=6289 RepID=C1K9Y9_HAECO|nr:mutant acetylcholine receptor monepantel-1 [Haemonchus contortus]ACO48339.1 mutant acetylcholine receptor monepantel-1 [Haemonchus contortus]
MENPSSGT